MRVGLTLAGANLTEDGAKFAAELGVTDVVVHLTNYQDGGDIDMAEIVRILQEGSYDGALVPDHVPDLTRGAPWHAGHACAVSYMKALVNNVQSLGASAKPH